MKGVISFDFDDTLASMTEEKQGLLWGIVSDELVPIKDVIDILMEKHKEGYEIHIVTAREEWDIPEVKGFVYNYQLPIKEIHHTSGGSKLPILNSSGSPSNATIFSIWSGLIIAGSTVDNKNKLSNDLF